MPCHWGHGEKQCSQSGGRGEGKLWAGDFIVASKGMKRQSMITRFRIAKNANLCNFSSLWCIRAVPCLVLALGWSGKMDGGTGYESPIKRVMGEVWFLDWLV